MMVKGKHCNSKLVLITKNLKQLLMFKLILLLSEEDKGLADPRNKKSGYPVLILILGLVPYFDERYNLISSFDSIR
jgi:hypothetical protein